MTWSWRGQAATGAVLIALVFVLDRSAWWLVLLVPHFVGTVAGCFQKVDAEQHATAASGPSDCTWWRSWWPSSA
ncbi:hypothetical protein [Streptomyces prasinus]|uniref:hypothetical protein n=1 Tax=Streptomyces prasinus TaxID=67345 RepID=UPI0036BF497E